MQALAGHTLESEGCNLCLEMHAKASRPAAAASSPGPHTKPSSPKRHLVLHLPAVHNHGAQPPPHLRRSPATRPPSATATRQSATETTASAPPRRCGTSGTRASKGTPASTPPGRPRPPPQGAPRMRAPGESRAPRACRGSWRPSARTLNSPSATFPKAAPLRASAAGAPRRTATSTCFAARTPAPRRRRHPWPPGLRASRGRAG